MKNFIRYLIIIVLLTATAGVCVATTPTIRRMLYYEFEVISFDNATGNASIAVTITPDRDTSLYVPKTVPEFCKEIPIQITTPDNLTFHSNQEMLLDFDGKENITIIVKVTLVEQSQVQLLFHATCTPTGKEITDYLFLKPDENKLSISRSSLTNAKKVVPLYQKPDRDTMTTEQLNVEYEIYVDLKEKEDFEYLNNIVDTLLPALKKGVYRAKLSLSQIYEIGERGFEAEFVHRPPWDKRTTTWENLETPPDTIPYKPITTIKHLTDSEVLNKRKQLAEGYVLTDKPNESFYIDGVMWQRNKGEQFFREIEPITDTKAFIKDMNDSLAALPDDHLFELCLFIPKELKPEAINILGKLPEPIENDFYHLNVRKGDLPKLQEAGIRVSFRKNTICNHSISSSNNGSKKKQAGV